MFELVSSLLLYSQLSPDAILVRVAELEHDRLQVSCDAVSLRHRAFSEVKRILDLATAYGFDADLWQNYLTWLLLTEENSFSLTCEMAGATAGGTINRIATADYEVFRQLFHYDFTALDACLGTDTFALLRDYHAIPKMEQRYNRLASERIRALSRQLAAATDASAFFELLVNDFKANGVGLFGLSRAFRIEGTGEGLRFKPIHNVDSVRLSDLIGYDIQKAQLRQNVEAFIAGKPCNNILLYGDAGTGKSTSVKAVLNEYGDRGLRMVEIYKHQFPLLGEVINRLKKRNYRFIIFMDDLSFEETEVEYKFLKAVIEGGIETRPQNILLCATSNRRHLIRETWKDRSDMEHNGDIHHSDTMEEKLSLAARFGCAISYTTPDRRLWSDIVKALAARHPELVIDEERLLLEANRWEIRHGGISGRCAQQFINDLCGRQ